MARIVVANPYAYVNDRDGCIISNPRCLGWDKHFWISQQELRDELKLMHGYNAPNSVLRLLDGGKE